MRQKHHKLIRDRIPEIIRHAGGECKVKTLSKSEYQQALLNKLVEEAQEAAQADSEHLVEELADIYEVIDAILAYLEIERSSVFEKQEQKRQEKGGFVRKLRLLWSQ